ncbi:MAG TPA: phosphohistidine phosphatase SixA [Chthoniobacterales bacterium]|jgi:phosphohistidine phosphatase
MKLCFLRHGEADWPNWNKPDDERPLTERGCKEMKRVAKFVERLKLSPDTILTSPLPRASQTAEIVAARLGITLQTEPALAHGFNIERLRRIVTKLECECVMVVGHEPEFSEVIKQLTGGTVKLSKAGIALLEVNRSCTSGKLLWLFPPKFAKAAK